jgi:hypothetical protein
MALLHSMRSSAARFLHPGGPDPGRCRRGRGRQGPHRGEGSLLFYWAVNGVAGWHAETVADL